MPHMTPVVKETEVIIFFVGFYKVTLWWVNLFQEAMDSKPKLIHSFAYDRSDRLKNSKQSHVSQGMDSLE